MSDALFRRDGDLYHPTPLTEGPWSPDAQHGGPPAALLAGAVEKCPTDVEMVVARITIELLRPVPLQPLRVASEVARPGRKVQLVSATLWHEDTEVARALGLKIRRTDLDLPFEPPEDDPIPGPEEGRDATFFANPGGFATEAMEIKMLAGDFAEAGPGQAWLRLRVPLVEGEETTGVERVAAAADFGNGVSNLAGMERNWLFINPDLEIRMTRPPEGEWIYLDSETRISPGGAGIASSTIADHKGWLGLAAQSLFVDAMEAG
ncbi:MAG: thioesterase family protein [Acidimicrobiia bacterium]